MLACDQHKFFLCFRSDLMPLRIFSTVKTLYTIMLGKGCFLNIHTFVFLFDSRNYTRLLGVTGLVWAKQQQFKPTMLTTLVLSALGLSFI